MIKKINKEYFEQLKSQSNMLGAKVFLVTVAGALTLTGCTEYKVVDMTNDEIKNDPPKHEEIISGGEPQSGASSSFTPEKIEKTELSDEMLAIMQTDVFLNGTLLNEFESTVSSIDVNYLHSELF